MAGSLRYGGRNGIMATIVAVNRHWVGRDTAAKRLVKMVNFLLLADSIMHLPHL